MFSVHAQRSLYLRIFYSFGSKSSALVSLTGVNTEEKCDIKYTGKSTKQTVSEHELGDYKNIKDFKLFHMLLILENL